MTLFHVNFATVDDAECLRDDNNLDAEELAQPNGLYVHNVQSALSRFASDLEDAFTPEP